MESILGLLFLPLFALPVSGQGAFRTDTVNTASGNLKITFIGHASLLFEFNSLYVYVDPFSELADFSKMPGADLVLITHEHFDHMDDKALSSIATSKTEIAGTALCAARTKITHIMKNGDTLSVKGLKIEAVPAYNILHKRNSKEVFHPKGNGNGYIITFADKRVYVAGDTENIPEMKNIKDINIAFLPMNLPYTMTPEMTAAAANTIQPQILYPYHYGETDVSRLKPLLDKGIDLRIRKMN